MSNAVFPTFAGLKWGSTRTPIHKTAVKETPSGREYRFSFMSSPRYLYKLSYEVLRETTGYSELQQLLGFFNARKGSFDSFLFTDPDDNAVTAQVFGVGDGATTAFQLVRTLGGAVEPVYDVNGSPALRIVDWQGDWPLYTVARGNACLWSEAFMDAVWAVSNASKSTTAVVAPDGVGTAFAIVENTANSSHYVVQSVAGFSTGAGYNFSVFLKAGGRNEVMVRFLAGGAFATTAYCIANLTTGQITGTQGLSASSIQALPNGWYRVTITATTTSAGSASVAVLLMSAGSSTYTGNGASGLYAWGAQVDGFGPVNRYIKTLGSPVSVTDYTLSLTGGVTTGFAPVNGAQLSWTGSYYWRVRFRQDQTEFSQFMRKLWEARTVELITVKP